MWRNLFRLQPLEEIKEYFGEKVALYFSFIGFYTSSLLPFSILGLVVMFFGLATYSDDTFVQQSCNLNLSLGHGFRKNTRRLVPFIVKDSGLLRTPQKRVAVTC